MKLIILDRDGVINYDSDNFVKSVDEFIPLPGSIGWGQMIAGAMCWCVCCMVSASQ